LLLAFVLGLFLETFYFINSGSATLNATISITNRIMCVGLRLNLLSYSSLYLVNPPNPPGRFTELFSAMEKL